MKKIIKMINVLVLIILLTACKESDNETYTISFDTSGGSTVQSLTKVPHAEITEPTPPTKEGHRFVGWFSDQSFTKPFKFNTMPKQNMTLYAKWTVKQYTITFNTNGGNDIHQVLVDYHTTIGNIEPVKDGYTFLGWYQDEALTSPFHQMPAMNITLYAKWSMNPYVITFETNGGSEVTTAFVNMNELITRPTTPKKDGYIFIDWYVDEDFTQPYDFNTLVNQDRVLYAKWIEATQDGFEFKTLQNNECSIDKYTGSSENIIIPKTYQACLITQIEPLAFSNLTIKEVMIPNTITTIGAYAFYQTPSLTRVIFEENSALTTIGSSAFSKSSLESIQLPQSLLEIGEGAFSFTHLETIIIPKNILIIPTGAFYKAQNLTEVIFEDNSQLTTIEDTAFYGTSLNEIMIPNSVKTIEDSAFSHIESLTNVTFGIDSKLVEIGNHAFYKTNIENLYIPQYVQKIENSAFASNTSLTHIEVSLDNLYFTVQDNVLFNKDMTHLMLYPVNNDQTNYTIPSGILTINENAFANAKLTHIELPVGLTEIGNNAFAFSEILNITIPHTVTTIHNGAFMLSKLEQVEFEEESRLIEIKDSAFLKTQLQAIDIPHSVTTIGKYAFREANSLNTVMIPNSVTYLGEGAFHGTKNLQTVSFEAGSTLKTIEMFTFSNSPSLTHINIPESVEIIYHYAFEGTHIETITIPKNVTHIYGGAFGYNDNLNTIIFQDESSLIYIGEMAFFTSSITSITIPNSVIEIDNEAFWLASNLETIEFEADSQLQKIGERAFSKTNIKSVTIPKSVIEINDLAFPETLESIIFEADSQLNSMSSTVFSNTSIKTITIPKNVISIHYSIFSNPYLESIIFETGTAINFINLMGFSESFNTLVIPNPTPPTIRFFEQCPQINIYVPNESIDTYIQSLGEDYSSRILSINGLDNQAS